MKNKYKKCKYCIFYEKKLDISSGLIYEVCNFKKLEYIDTLCLHRRENEDECGIFGKNFTKTTILSKIENFLM